MTSFENEDNEATLRHRQLMGETPGPEHAHQQAREGPNTQKRSYPNANAANRASARSADDAEDADDGDDEPDDAREPAPGDANPLSDPDGRPLDRRTSSV